MCYWLYSCKKGRMDSKYYKIIKSVSIFDTKNVQPVRKANAAIERGLGIS